MLDAEFLESLSFQLRDRAGSDFWRTPEGALLSEKLDTMEQECKTILAPHECAFVDNCFSLLTASSSAENRFVYRQGVLDAVHLLKLIGVLT